MSLLLGQPTAKLVRLKRKFFNLAFPVFIHTNDIKQYLGSYRKEKFGPLSIKFTGFTHKSLDSYYTY